MSSPKILLIRHAEKPDETAAGVTVEGRPSDKSLTVRGWQRAGALVPFLATANTPRFLFASHSSSDRPRETLEPLSAQLGIAVNLDYGKGDEAKLAEAAKACEGIVLISWQHEYMAALATAILGDPAAAPPPWPKNRFDLIWIFTLDTVAGRYAFAQMPQMLLADDSPEM